MTRFQDKIVLVTGGANGQGREEAVRLVAEGCRVVIGDVQDQAGRLLVETLGDAATYLHLDVASEADWSAAIAHCAELGGLHGLINNAGIYRPRPIADTDVASFEDHFRINQLGTFLGIKYASSLMKRNGGGSIVNISSTAGLQGIPNAISYVATKWAVHGMTKAAALELAPDGIRVNSVHPGLVDTAMLGSRDPADLQRRVKDIPLKRMGTTGDVADIVLFLLSSQSAYMTGASIVVDGGLSL